MRKKVHWRHFKQLPPGPKGKALRWAGLALGLAALPGPGPHKGTAVASRPVCGLAIFHAEIKLAENATFSLWHFFSINFFYFFWRIILAKDDPTCLKNEIVGRGKRERDCDFETGWKL